MERFDLTAIIVSYGHGETLGRALSSLRHLENDLVEVVVVDNAGDLGKTRLGTVGRVIPELFDPGENLGFSAAVNVVARRARAGHLLLLSPDAELLVWDGKRLAGVLEGNAGLVGSLTLDRDDRPALSWGEFPGARTVWRRLTGRRGSDRRKNMAKLRNGGEIAVDWVLGSAVVIPKKTFLAVNGFDQTYFSSGEDQEFGARLAAVGFDVVVSPAWVVRHVPRNPDTLRDEIRTNNRRFVSRYGSASDRIVWWFRQLPKLLTDATRIGRRTGE